MIDGMTEEQYRRECEYYARDLRMRQSPPSGNRGPAGHVHSMLVLPSNRRVAYRRIMELAAEHSLEVEEAHRDSNWRHADVTLVAGDGGRASVEVDTEAIYYISHQRRCRFREEPHHRGDIDDIIHRMLTHITEDHS